MKAAACFLLAGAFNVWNGSQVLAALSFLIALGLLADQLPPSCARHCNQGRRGCVCRGMPPQ